jgi:hypothetical protein
LGQRPSEKRQAADLWQDKPLGTSERVTHPRPERHLKKDRSARLPARPGDRVTTLLGETREGQPEKDGAHGPLMKDAAERRGASDPRP